MNRRLCIALVSGVLATVLLSAPTPLLAQKKTTKPAPAKLPSPAKIMDDSADAIGSAAAFAKLKTMRMRGKISIPAQNITGTMETQMKFPDKVYVLQNIAGFGKAEQGYDGKVGWSLDPINGLRTLAGGELDQMKRQSDEIKTNDWRKLYQKPVLLGIRKVGTMSTYAIQMTPKASGKPVVTYYDIKTKLPVRTDVVVETAQGSVPTQSFSSDFRSVGGVKIPFTTRQVVGGVSEVNVTFDSVQVNVPVDEKLFAKPKAPAPKMESPAKP
ncbi:MAG: hypothetical protein H8F28_08865 [Fibrella sp.]|nr:hypothetical protein [Armatimonadota bacterium]